MMSHFQTRLTAPMRLAFRSIQPDTGDWPLFLDMCYKYMSENWPDRTQELSEPVFKSHYDQSLRNRLEQGGRGLFLYYQKHAPIGFSNVYISMEGRGKTLNVAELYVDPLYRKQGCASQMVEHVIEWGREQVAIHLKIEVDKNLPNSNRFWSKFGFDLDSSGLRNVYFSKI